VLGSASRNGKSDKKYPVYHCGGAKSGKRCHDRFSIVVRDFDTVVQDYLDNLRFHEDFLAKLEPCLIDQYREREKEIVLEAAAIGRTVADLKVEQAQKISAFGLAESAVTRRLLEEQIANLDDQIRVAEGQRTDTEINEKSIKAFIRQAKQLMEHPVDLLKYAEELPARRALVSLFFVETPSYEEIVNRTAKLRPIFWLSEEFKREESQLVNPRGLQWNTIEEMIVAWDYIFNTFELLNKIETINSREEFRKAA
jgi:hypothetical protein